MGVSMLTPAPSVEDNINLGDKDSIRRRALLALEGKADVGAFSRVDARGDRYLYPGRYELVLDTVEPVTVGSWSVGEGVC